MAKKNRKETREIEEQLRKEAEQERKKTRIFLIIGVVIVVAILVYALYERIFIGTISPIFFRKLIFFNKAPFGSFIFFGKDFYEIGK